jgi:hypothetical protein
MISMSMAQYNLVPPTIADGKISELQVTAKGTLLVTIADGTNGLNVITVSSSAGDAISNAFSRLWAYTNGFLWNGATWDKESKATTTARLLSAAASTNATSVKASAGNVFNIVGTQTNAAARYLKLYNKASAPTVGTDTPIWTFYLPPTAVGGGLFTLDFGAQPLYFSTGIAYALTTAAADADTGALSAGDVIAMNIAYS